MIVLAILRLVRPPMLRTSIDTSASTVGVAGGRARSAAIGLRGAGRALLVVLTCAGCGASSRAGGFDADVPGARVDAIERVVADWRATHRTPDLDDRMGLVECLNSDDDLVRFAAIGALKEITGQTHGYSYDAPAASRMAASREWRSWALDPPARANGTAEATR